MKRKGAISKRKGSEEGKYSGRMRKNRVVGAGYGKVKMYGGKAGGGRRMNEERGGGHVS